MPNRDEIVRDIYLKALAAGDYAEITRCAKAFTDRLPRKGKKDTSGCPF